MLPSDHYVREEGVLRDALAIALARAENGQGRSVLLGIEPDETDTDLGYVLPGGADPAGGQRVAKFVEKPTSEVAAELIERGGLWNAFIIAALGRTLLDLFLPRYSSVVMEMQVILSRSRSLGAPAGGWPAIVDLYMRLPSLDFSRDVLEHKVDTLRVVRVPPCGWSDLGTPHRVGEALQRLRVHRVEDPEADFEASSHVNLAAQHAQFERIARLGA